MHKEAASLQPRAFGLRFFFSVCSWVKCCCVLIYGETNCTLVCCAPACRTFILEELQHPRMVVVITHSQPCQSGTTWASRRLHLNSRCVKKDHSLSRPWDAGRSGGESRTPLKYKWVAHLCFTATEQTKWSTPLRATVKARFLTR